MWWSSMGIYDASMSMCTAVSFYYKNIVHFKLICYLVIYLLVSSGINVIIRNEALEKFLWLNFYKLQFHFLLTELLAYYSVISFIKILILIYMLLFC